MHELFGHMLQLFSEQTYLKNKNEIGMFKKQKN